MRNDFSNGFKIALFPQPAATVQQQANPATQDHGPWKTVVGKASLEQALAASAAVGGPRIVQIGCDLPGARWAVEAAATHDALVAGVALHPNEAPRLAASGDLEAAYAEIEALAQAHDKVRAVGETGLDHFRTGDEGRAARN